MAPRQYQPALRRLANTTTGNRRGAPKPLSRIRAIRHPRPQHDRRTSIAKVLALWPHEIDDESRGGRLKLLARLRSALRAERRRGVSAHWTYDLARHVELLRIYREELAAIAGRQAGNGAHKSPKLS
jgi:hypothetical protein